MSANALPGPASRAIAVLAGSSRICRAAINLYAKEYGLDVVPRVTLPEKPPERQRWLTRSEAASLLSAALRLRRKSPSHYGHLPRFILLGLYTGTRHRAILGLNWNPGVSGGWPDLENGVLYRKGLGAIETKKRQPPMRLPPRLLAHLARWKRLDLGRGPVVHNPGANRSSASKRPFARCAPKPDFQPTSSRTCCATRGPPG